MSVKTPCQISRHSSFLKSRNCSIERKKECCFVVHLFFQNHSIVFILDVYAFFSLFFTSCFFLFQFCCIILLLGAGIGRFVLVGRSWLITAKPCVLETILFYTWKIGINRYCSLYQRFLEFLPLLECNENRQELFSHYQKFRCHLELHSLQFLVVSLYICFIRWVLFASFHVRRAPSYSHNICIFFCLLDSFSYTLLLCAMFSKKTFPSLFSNPIPIQQGWLHYLFLYSCVRSRSTIQRQIRKE